MYDEEEALCSIIFGSSQGSTVTCGKCCWAGDWCSSATPASWASALTTIARNVYGQGIAPADWRPTKGAVASIGLSLGLGMASAAGGYLISLTGYASFFLVAAFAALFAAPLILSLLRPAMKVALPADG